MKCRLCGKEILTYTTNLDHLVYRNGVSFHTECVEANTRATQAGGRR